MVRMAKMAGWLIIGGGMVVSAARVVMALAAQAFDQVAAAGAPAVYCLLGGALLLLLANVLDDVRGSARLLSDLIPTRPKSIIGLTLLLCGLGWVAYTYISLNEPSVRAWAIVPAAPGGLAALVGLVLMLTAALERRP